MASVVVILSSLTGGTGNLTTAQRIADFVREGQRRDVRLRDCADFASPEELDTYLDGVGATLVIGVHMYRAGKLFSQRPRARILILGGTDINENVRDAAKAWWFARMCSCCRTDCARARHRWASCSALWLCQPWLWPSRTRCAPTL